MPGHVVTTTTVTAPHPVPTTTTTTRPPPPTTTTTKPPAATVISIAGYSFAPNPLTIPVGTTVTVVNHDSVTHTWTASSPAGAFDSGPIAPDGSYSFTFHTAGTYDYMCTIHPYMTGELTVT